VLIHLPKGTYVPQFARRAERAETPIDAAPVSRRRRSSPLRWLLVGMVVATAVAGVLAVRVGRDQGRAGVKGGAPALSLAVLPFVAYGRVAPGLADRLTDGLIGEMTREANVAVRSRTSVMPFRGVQRSLREVATALDADLVMEGSVASEGGKLIVEARLVHSAADRKLWAEEFEGSSNDLRALQRQIATAAAAAIRRVR